MAVAMPDWRQTLHFDDDRSRSTSVVVGPFDNNVFVSAAGRPATPS